MPNGEERARLVRQMTRRIMATIRARKLEANPEVAKFSTELNQRLAARAREGERVLH
jgi:hypothetical protein